MAKILKADERKAVIEHYERMIAWAQEQPPRRMALKYIMADAIGENWDGS